MTKMGIGIDYANVGCVKVTRGSFDPLVTNDSERWKFIFNSKWAKDVRVGHTQVNWRNLPRGFYSINQNNDLWSAGSQYSGGNRDYEIMAGNLFGIGSSVIYNLPLFQSSRIEGGQYVGRRKTITFLGSGDETKVFTIADGTSAQAVAFNATWGAYGANAGDYTVINMSGRSSSVQDASAAFSVWNLPGDETEIENGVERPAVSGQPQVIITPSALRVSKPGFNANVATGSQLAIDTSNVPAKVIGFNDVLVPSGQSSFNVGYQLPPNSVIDCHFYKDGDPIWYPSGPYGELIGASFYLSGSSIVFNNSYGPVRARYIILASDTTPATGGANDVWKQFNDGVKDVFQLLRPGAGPSPSFADIAMDSRWPTMQILRDGYIPVADGYNRENTVTYDGSNMFVFIKFVTVHNGFDRSATFPAGLRSASKFIRSPRTTLYQLAGQSGFWGGYNLGGDSCIVRYNQSSATFITAKGSPMWEARYQQQGGGFRYETTYDPDPIQGIRYYVFGIASPE